jgi:hypothetical protein
MPIAQERANRIYGLLHRLARELPSTDGEYEQRMEEQYKWNETFGKLETELANLLSELKSPCRNRSCNCQRNNCIVEGCYDNR